jgi:hypothetical protein
VQSQRIGEEVVVTGLLAHLVHELVQERRATSVGF